METTQQQLKDLVSEVFSSHAYEIQPRYPLVLCRVLPKEQQTQGGLWLPDTATKASDAVRHGQNKPVYEAIVLKVWEPFWKEIKRFKIWVPLLNGKPPEIETLIEHNVTEIKVESELKPGDHVLFPAWLGIPVPGLDGWPPKEFGYRLIPESDKSGENNCILAVLEYERPKINKLLSDSVASWMRVSDSPVEALVNQLLEDYDVIPVEKPRTTSGK